MKRDPCHGGAKEPQPDAHAPQPTHRVNRCSHAIKGQVDAISQIVLISAPARIAAAVERQT
eukprot:465797-Prymnesium_polylepis.1